MSTKNTVNKNYENAVNKNLADIAILNDKMSGMNTDLNDKLSGMNSVNQNLSCIQTTLPPIPMDHMLERDTKITKLNHEITEIKKQKTEILLL